ncbi:unnamed protein product [Durusdinium trenchii]|uniref:Uncharacterized protein n=1 Tax=Durusdinium trenchii TaxID=1381693 RepID=A0ABP0P855_9DINO
MSMRVETLYEVLGTNAHASAAEVKAAFKRQALVLHPDKGGSKEAFQRALRAFEVLSDDSSRSEYDQRLQKASRNRWSFQKTGAAGGEPNESARVRGQRSRSSDSASLPRARALVLRRRRSACALCRPNRPGPGEEGFWSGECEVDGRSEDEEDPVVRGEEESLDEEDLCSLAKGLRQPPSTPVGVMDSTPSPGPGGLMRGIASFYRKGTVFYQVSLCIQSLCMTARKVRELDRAVDILLMLMSIKQKMGGIVDPSLFVQKMTDAVPAAFEEYGVTAEEMGLRFQVMMCMRFWVRPPLHTPQQAKLEDALQAWSRLTRFRSPLGQGAGRTAPGRAAERVGARGFARMDLKELEDERDGRQLERWRAFREVYLDILTEGGPSDQSRRFNASRRLDALAEVEWARCSTAAELFRVDLQCLLEDSGARWHAAAQSLGEAARKGDLNVMMAKLLDGGDPNERDHLHPKYTPLHRAASGGHRHAVRLLLKAKADVLMRDRLGFSALHFAANQSVGLVSDLVEAKCDVNAANLQQMTPLHSAAGMGRVDICEFLLAAGAGAGPHGLATPADLARRAAERRPARSVEQEACLRLAERLVQASEAKGSWFYESEPVDSGHLTSEWLPFTSTASDELEAALLRGEEELEIQTPAGYRVLVDLKSKLQRNTATGCTRRVRRDTPSPAPDPTLEPRAPWVPAAPGHWGGLVSTGAQKWRVTSTS